MAKFKQKIDNNTASLFDYLKSIQDENQKTPTEGSMDIDRRFRESVNEGIKRAPGNMSRWDIAAKMSELIGTDITKTMLDSWTAESKEGHRFPAIYVPAFCEVVKYTEPLKVLGMPVGVFVLPGPEALRAEIQKLEETIRQTAAEKRKRLLFLKEMEG
jgi:hypothetical protein